MKTLAITISLCLLSLPAMAWQEAQPSHLQVVRSVANMVSDGGAQTLARSKGLQVLNVLWEDTGRYKGSSVGPNISDVTIEVQAEDAQGRLQRALMPVIRFPNFHDKTGDVRLDKLFIRVGNQDQGGQLTTIGLRTFL